MSDIPWIEWNGGDQAPIPDGVRYQFLRRCDDPEDVVGDVWEHRPASRRWQHCDDPYDIIAYRVRPDWEALCGELGAALRSIVNCWEADGPLDAVIREANVTLAKLPAGHP